MTTFRRVIHSGLAGLVAALATANPAWSQTTSPVPESGQVGGMGLVAFIFVVGLIVATGMTVKFYDMKRKRDDQAVALQSRLSDALLTEPSVSHLPITPTVHVPFGKHGQAIVEISGKVPGPDHREVALRVVQREVSSLVDDYRIEDHLFIDPQMTRRAAA